MCSYRGLLQASEEVVVLELEDVLVGVLLHLQPRLLGRYSRLGRPLLRHESGPAGRLRYLDARQPGFLQRTKTI